jgi:NitT/TauT family transport system permease protein
MRTAATRPSAQPAAALLPTVLSLAVVAAVWEAWIALAGTPVYLLPAPSAVALRVGAEPGYFLGQGAITLAEALGGFLLGTGVALAAATVMAHSRTLERALLPLAVLVKVTPIVAVAPLFVIWFGFGSMPKVLVAALITFFPVLVNAMTGLRSVSPEALDLFRSLNASRTDIFWRLRAPSSLPYLFAAFRIAIPLSVIGAVVGEWFTGDRGLGSVIIVAHNNLHMDTLFSAVLVLAFIGISLTILTAYAERRVLFWHDSSIVS